MDRSATSVPNSELPEHPFELKYKQYQDERDLPLVMNLIDNELSEPYSIFTYRYFLHSWPHLCFLAFDGDHCFGTIVAKMERHREALIRGYIAMLVVEKKYRYLGVGSQLVKRAIQAMMDAGCEEVALEAEVTNSGALQLYQKLGFIRDKRLQRYYLNGNDAFRLKLLLPQGSQKAALDRQDDESWVVQQMQRLGVQADEMQCAMPIMQQN